MTPDLRRATEHDTLFLTVARENKDVVCPDCGGATEAVETRYGIALMCVECHAVVSEIDLDAAEEAGVWY